MPNSPNLLTLPPTSDFILGQTSLWNIGDGPLQLDFGRPIFAAGAMIKPNANNKDYVGKIEAFNSVGVSLGFFEETFAKETAEFMGVFDTQESIKSLQFSVALIDPEVFNSNDFFLGRLDFLASRYDPCPPCPPVPLPGSLLLVGSVLLGALGLRRLKS